MPSFRGLRAVVPIALLGACSTGSNAVAREWEAQLAAAPPCPVDVRDADLSTWRQIQSRGFSLCVPPTWRLLRRPSVTGDPYGAGGWRAGDLSFQWRYAPGARVQECGMDERAGEQQWVEQIGGEDVCIMLTLRNIRAYWGDGLLMGGTGRDALSTARLLSVVRTVRLLTVPPPPPGS